LQKYVNHYKVFGKGEWDCRKGRSASQEMVVSWRRKGDAVRQ